MELSIKERLILSNQYRILEKLYPEEAPHFSNHRKAIEDGYKLHYGDLVEHLYDEMTVEQCREVLDVLEMFSRLRYAYDDFDDKSDISEDDIKFPGFDGNNEPEQMGYTQYFIDDLGRFGTLSSNDYNSHSPMLDMYRRMLDAWEHSNDKFRLTKDDVERILEACKHPDSVA